MEHKLTLEHIPPGHFPEWLFQQLCLQVLDPRVKPILVIHSSEASREELINRLESAEIGPIDRSRHHTLASLRKSIHADLRLPRLLPYSGPSDRLIHAECELAAKQGDFPLLHPISEHHWGEGRTRALARLAEVFDSEDIRKWDGPGMIGFERRLRRMGIELNGFHPLLHQREINDRLGKLENAPFTLTGIAGILVMDQLPTLSVSNRQMLLHLNRFSDIHQLCQHGEAPIGNFRLGLHGAILEDVEPCTSENQPEWLPTHDIWIPEPCAQPVNRVLIPTSGLEIPASVELLRDWVASANPEATVLIIDPGCSEREDIWRRKLTEIGLRLSRNSSTLKSSPAIHWFAELASIGYGNEAWSMSRIRGLGNQQSLQFCADWLNSNSHPTKSDWTPEMDAERIEVLARTWHILGGYGALSTWLRALASPPLPAPWEDIDESGQKAECTQWWFLNLLCRLSPLLSSGERALLGEKEILTGCHTGEELPLPKISTDGDSWLAELVSFLDKESMSGDEMGAIQLLVEEHESLRLHQSLLGHNISSGGSKWIEDFLGHVNELLAPKIPEASDRVRLLTPVEALGCTADIVVLTHLTNSDWSLKVEKLPWLSEEDCKIFDLCRPDGPLREGRHAIHHILHSSENTFLIDPTGLDEDCQPSTPLAEWLSQHTGSRIEEAFTAPAFLPNWSTSIGEKTRGYHLSWKPASTKIVREQDYARAEVHISGRSVRDSRQRAGLALRDNRQPHHPPLNPLSISIPLDAHLMQDRLSRQPTEILPDDEYIGMELHDRFCGIGGMRLVPSNSGAPGEIPPRDAESWPVLGGKKGRGQLLAIDPRPLKPSATSLPVFDQRNGQNGQKEFERKRWSASRLQSWQTCPRKGWLERRLQTGKMEQQDDDLDARIRGNIIHQSLGILFEKVFSLPEGIERPSKDATSLASVGKRTDEMFAHILDYIGQTAPWLEREDATAAQRRHDLIGFSRKKWLDWLASPKPTSPTGRLGNLLLAEMKLHNSIPISIEWPLGGMELYHPDGRKMEMSGFIDRVDVIKTSNLEDGNDTVAPLDWSSASKWKPKRLILIRDIKSIDGPKVGAEGERHRKALFNELQLALYARCWEISHPGDLVVGVGISEVGSSTSNRIEVSPAFSEFYEDNGIGEVTKLTENTHRFPDEDSSPDSDHFRAWIQERLTTAFDVADSANAGIVRPTPEENTCRWCNVKEICGLASTVGGDKSWS